MTSFRLVPVAAFFAIAGCREPAAYTVVGGPRDWGTDPAIVTVDAPGDVFAVSDVHGGYSRLVTLLQANGLVDANQSWVGAHATLVVVGDLIDKGPSGLEVVDFLQAVQAEAPAAGGTVIVTVGNHEAEFFADPTNSKATSSDGFDAELDSASIDPVTFASGADSRGLWLRDRPVAVVVGGWFFAHAGNTSARNASGLEQDFEAAFERADYRDDEFVGDNSILEARDWYADPSVVTSSLGALGVEHIVFGHDPNALGPRGQIAVASSGALFRIDCGMSPDVDDSEGMLLHIHGDTADQLDSAGNVTHLWP